MKKIPIENQPLVTLTSLIENKSSQTLLEFLAARFKYLSPTEWTDQIKTGAVLVNGRQASENQPLRAGDKVDYTTSAWEEPAVNTNYRILHEDEALVIVSKPSPLPVHAIGAYFRNTLMTLLRQDRPEARHWHLVHRLDSETSGVIALVKDAESLKNLQKQFASNSAFPSPLVGEGERSEGEGAVAYPSPKGDANRPGVHRGESPYGSKLGDMGEIPHERQRGDEGRVRGAVSIHSSAVVGAGHAPPAAGSFAKTYRAIVFGQFPAGKKVFDGAIGSKVGSKVRMKLTVILPEDTKKNDGHPERERRIYVSDAKPSITEFELLEVKGNFSLLEARPLTGRTHQIRVHLEHLGFPIVGDKIYSGTDETFLHFYEHGWDDWLKERILLPRQALHAYRLEFIHPVTGRAVVFEDPLPEDLMNFWSSL